MLKNRQASKCSTQVIVQTPSFGFGIFPPKTEACSVLKSIVYPVGGNLRIGEDKHYQQTQIKQIQ